MGDMYKITAPVGGFTGEGAGGVMFSDGVAEVDSDRHAAALAYFKQARYGVEKVDDNPKQARKATSGKPEGRLPEDAPNKSASKADWVAYAVAHDVPAEEAEALTRDRLVERFTISEEPQS